MAPESSTLKRKRSRPSEWWAAAPSPAPPQTTQQAQSRKIQEAPTPGNRGNSEKEKKVDGARSASKQIQVSKEGRASDVGDDELVLNSGKGKENRPRRETRRSTGGQDEGESNAGTLNEEQTKTQAKSGHLIASTGGYSPDVERATQAIPKKKGGRPTAEEAHMKLGIQGGTKSSSQSKLNMADRIKPQKRGRPSNTGDELEAASTVVNDVSSKKVNAKLSPNVPDKEVGNSVRRGRSSNNEAEIQAIFDEATRIFPSAKKVGEAPAIREAGLPNVNLTQEDPPHKRRTRRSNDPVADATIIGKVESNSNSAHRGRPSGTVLEVETATSTFAKDRSKTKKSMQTAPVNSSLKPSKKAKTHTEPLAGKTRGTDKVKHTRPATNKARAKKRKNVEESRSSTQPKRRRVEEQPESDEDEVPQVDQIPTYQHLEPVTRHVSHRTITTKWEHLEPNSIEHISKLLHDLQRPVIVRLTDERKKNEASTALQMVSDKIVHKISKGLPFPIHPADDFDFEKVIDQIRVLGAQLTPALHANQLLEAELRKETMLLKSEEAALKELEDNAKSAKSQRKEASRNFHPLLRLDGISDESYTTNDIGLRADRNKLPLNLDIQEVQSLNMIFEDLKGHVDSIQGNLNQVQGITEAIGKSKAAVQASLFDHLDPIQYQNVVLGGDV